MEANSVPFKKNRALLPWIIAICLMPSLFSCKEKYPKQVSCVKLTNEQLKKWVNKGYLNPQDSTIIRLKAAYAWPGILYKVYAGVQQSNGNLIEESVIALSPVDTCTKNHIKLDEFVFSGTLQVNVADWKIWKTGGGKALDDSLQFIRLDPYSFVYEGLPLLAYRDYITKKGNVQIPGQHYTAQKTIYSILPCPPCPNCKNPCPPPYICVAPCTGPQMDTTDITQ